MSRERIFRFRSENVRRAGERGVSGRFPFSEWTPVRHKRNPRHLNPRLGNRSAGRTEDWNKVWDPNKGTVTFFFRNFPNDCSVNLLTEKFKRIAAVRDVFIPAKKGKDGTRYGFVRFGGNVDKNRVEIMLNKIWIGSFKLRANLSKFTRQSVKQPLRVEKAFRKQQICSQALRREEVSYKEALLGRATDTDTRKGRSEERKCSNGSGNVFVSDGNQLEFLKNYFLGCLKDDEIWEEVGGLINDLW